MTFKRTPGMKYNNTKVMVGDIKFDSKREAKRWQELCLLERAGDIRCLERQVPYILAAPVVLSGRKKPSLRYRADFVYKIGEQVIVEDAKNPYARKNDGVYRIKKHLMKLVHDIEIMEV